MQDIPMSAGEYPEESDNLIEEMTPSTPSRFPRMLVAGTLALAVVVLAGASLRGGSTSVTGISPSGLDAVILRAETPQCETFDDACRGCGGVECVGCKANVNLRCCVAKAESDDAKKACCSNEDFKLADKAGVCDIGCQTFEEACKGCGGEQCSYCKATVNLQCCVSKASTDEDKKACCVNDDFKLADKEGVCDVAAPSPGTCSEAGEGCLQTRCCKDPKLTCFKKNEYWADCRQACEPGKVDPNSPADLQSPWNCSKITRCSAAGDGCMSTGCCQDQSLTCFVKNDHWADCKKACEPGKVDPNSPQDQQSPWSCEKKCSVAGDGCLTTGCCQDPSLKCFKKNDKWADCKKTCEPGKVDPNSPEDQQSPWSCTEMTMVVKK
jgi:hypothetical protein